MSRLNFQNKIQGHRYDGPSNRDLQQKLSYQQLMNLNHDLTKENQQLKNIANRLGQELKNLHSQFDIKPREQNAQLQHAIGNHPILQKYELTLLPLLDAYEAKIQEFEQGFEIINQQFIWLQKKYEDVTAENEQLKSKLTQKIKQIIELYKNGSSQKLGSDFGQIILQQINEKQKYLVEQNGRLEKEHQKYKSEAERTTKELMDVKKRDQQNKSKVNQYQITNKQLQNELKNLKQNIFSIQMRSNELENEKKKIQNDLQRALTQVSQLNKQKQIIFKNYDHLKTRYEKDINPLSDVESNRVIDSLKSKLAVFENHHDIPDDSHKKLSKLQKQYDNLLKQKNKYKEQLDLLKIKLEESQESYAEIRKKLDAFESEKTDLQLSESKLKKTLQQLNQKCKNDLAKMRKANEEQNQRIEDQFVKKIEAKQKKLLQLEQTLDKVKLERDKLEKQNIIHTTLNKDGGKNLKSKDSDKVVEKLKEKLSINEELFKQQLQIVQNDNAYLKKQAQSYKNDAKEKSDELRKIRQQLQKTKKQLQEITEQKTLLIEEIKRVRNEYEGNLKDKQRLFDQKIKQIKTVVEESDKRRKLERQKVAEASRQYKRVLEEIKNTYEERIRALENESNYNSKARKIENY